MAVTYMNLKVPEVVTYGWDICWGEDRGQRIARYYREGLVRHRKDGELDMRYASSKFIADPKAGTLIWPKLA